VGTYPSWAKRWMLRKLARRVNTNNLDSLGLMVCFGFRLNIEYASGTSQI
jgi:hypothetical protein